MERWPQYKGRIVLDGQGNPHIHLSVLTYFLFWTAFYVLRGSHASHTAEATRPVRTLSLTPNFGSVKKVSGATAMTWSCAGGALIWKHGDVFACCTAANWPHHRGRWDRRAINAQDEHHAKTQLALNPRN